MKVYSFLLLVSALLPAAAFSQATNTFPSTGNVGIGTQSPIEKLHIENGRIYLNSGVTINGTYRSYFHWIGHSLIMGSRPGTYAHNSVDLIPGGSNTGPLTSSLRIYSAPMLDSAIMKIQLYSDGFSFFNGGNVGIGTTAPFFLLHASGSGVTGIAVQNTAALTASSGGFVRIYNSGIPTQADQRLGCVLFGANTSGTTYTTAAQIECVTPGAWTAGTSNPGILRFMTTSAGQSAVTEKMRITEAGNVGIGTTDTKGYRLAVNGDAIFTRIKVKALAAWPDYVFEENYPLLSLPELAHFIKSNKHLPEMPVATEIKNDGMDVAEMNRKLLQKVEELTLYLLKEHQKNEEQEKEINTLKEKINEMRK